MKKSYLSFILLIGLAFSTKAQDTISKNAIGLRFGNNYGLVLEITYQKMLSPKKRLEFGVSWSSDNNTNALKLTGIYQWYWRLEKGLYWYTGFGGGLGTWNTNDNYNNAYGNDNGIFAILLGDIGIEYHFNDVPIQLSIDGRPGYTFNNYEKDDFGLNAGFAIRYKF